jgi:hypothetical protein
LRSRSQEIGSKSPLKSRTIEILQGEFANHHEPLDLGELQGRYGDVFPKDSKLRRAFPLIQASGVIGSLVESPIGIHEERVVNLVTGIAKSRYAISRQLKGSVGPQRSWQVDRWHKSLGFRGEKSRSINIKIHDLVNPKMSME